VRFLFFRKPGSHSDWQDFQRHNTLWTHALGDLSKRTVSENAARFFRPFLRWRLDDASGRSVLTQLPRYPLETVSWLPDPWFAGRRHGRHLPGAGGEAAARRRLEFLPRTCPTSVVKIASCAKQDRLRARSPILASFTHEEPHRPGGHPAYFGDFRPRGRLRASRCSKTSPSHLNIFCIISRAPSCTKSQRQFKVRNRCRKYIFVTGGVSSLGKD